MSVEQLIAFIGSGAIVSLLTWLLNRKRTKSEIAKTEADIRKAATDTEKTQIDTLGTVTDLLAKNVRTLSEINDGLEKRLEHCKEQLRLHKIELPRHG